MLKFVKKVWGSEEWLVNSDLYCAKYLNLVRGYQCSLHYHEIKDETFYILEGRVDLEIQYQEGGVGIRRVMALSKGDQFRIKPGLKHKFLATSDTAKILEVSTTHFDSDSYRLEPSGQV